ncbi:MAG: hypothetical protein S4CHLAM81_02430 [Chlamydiales bacterium]|nr:hypothetical protein [Chlamydiales bacterium]MCH9635035.1 hypothetical protein [Chlamydiales bacterium]
MTNTLYTSTYEGQNRLYGLTSYEERSTSVRRVIKDHYKAGARRAVAVLVTGVALLVVARLFLPLSNLELLGSAGGISAIAATVGFKGIKKEIWFKHSDGTCTQNDPNNGTQDNPIYNGL